jgi:hypothetical protein
MPMPQQNNNYDKKHLRNIAVICARIDRIFNKAAEEAALIGATIKDDLGDRIFSFSDYPQTRKQIDALTEELHASLETTIVNGIDGAWALSNGKNDDLVRRVFGRKADDLPEAQRRRYFNNNAQALEAFLARKTQGLGLSDRVWRYTTEFKNEIELGLDLGIRSGKSAAAMTRDLRQYLQHPDKLFRRVRDEHGLLKLSQAAKDFHPGRGVYRSSYMNARRLAATETNIAYRTADHLRWQKMDFVVGIEIVLSNNHTIRLQPGEKTSDLPGQMRADGTPKANAVRTLTDICDTLAGRYPKDFKFTGWHPHCRCHAVTILKTEEEMARDTKRILDGRQSSADSANAVTDTPEAFKNWVEDNRDRIANGHSLPYFIRDNAKYTGITAKQARASSTTLGIAAERHAKRTIADIKAIQDRWNERREPTYKPYKMTQHDIDKMVGAGWVDEQMTLETWENGIANGFDLFKVVNDIEKKCAEMGIGTGLPRIKSGNIFRFTYSSPEFYLERSIRRNADGLVEARHEMFSIFDKQNQGKGLSKTVLRTFYEEYRKSGVDLITVHANIDVGGYTWAKYGFRCQGKSGVERAINWQKLTEEQATSLHTLIDEWFAEDEERVFPMKKIADLTYGKNALLGQDWYGTLDLRDKAQRMVFEKYLGI